MTEGPKVNPSVYYHEAESRIKSGLFFALGNEGKKRFLQQNAHVSLNNINFRDFYAACERLFKRDKSYIVEIMHKYNANQGEEEGLEAFYLRLAGQAAKCGWAEDTENEVIKDFFIAKMRLVDIQRELCIRPGKNIDETLKSALLQEKGYVTANTPQKQNPSASTSGNPIRIK